MSEITQNKKERRALPRLIVAALLIRLAVALAAFPFSSWGDQPLFVAWANHAAKQGIHQAYFWGYDWLPLYLYLSKLVGTVYVYSGLAAQFGSSSYVLLLLLKIPMMLLNLLVGWLIYRVVEQLYGPAGRPLRAAAIYLFNPAIILASCVFGYQDAFHTALVFLAVFALCTERDGWVPALTALACLTKPQATIFLLPIWIIWLYRTGFRGLLRGAAAGSVTAGLVLLPFILYHRMGSVIHMYARVPRIHRWLTGCADNIWWIHWPVPPYHSDRIPLVYGLDGLTLGLILFGLFTLGALAYLLRRPGLPRLIHVCAFLAFAFFMVVTEIHENHLYAMFAFLTVLVTTSRPLRWLYAGLSITFTLNVALSLWLLHTNDPVMVGPIRLSIANAVANVLMLGAWSYLVLLRELRVSPSAPPPAGKPPLVAAPAR